MGRGGQPGQMGVRLVNPEILGSLEHAGRAPSLSAHPDHGDLRKRDSSLGGGNRCWGKDSQGRWGPSLSCPHGML